MQFAGLGVDKYQVAGYVVFHSVVFRYFRCHALDCRSSAGINFESLTICAAFILVAYHVRAVGRDFDSR